MDLGYGLIIYENWRNELRKEEEKGLETIDCLYPHIFIHYENKMRIKQFLELCIPTILRRSKELETEALYSWASAIKNDHLVPSISPIEKSGVPDMADNSKEKNRQKQTE